MSEEKKMAQVISEIQRTYDDSVRRLQVEYNDSSARMREGYLKSVQKIQKNARFWWYTSMVQLAVIGLLVAYIVVSSGG